MKPLMRFKEQLQLTNEQQQALKKLRQEMAPQIHQGLQQAKQLEQQLAQEILQDQKTATDLEKGLLKLQQQKWNNTQKLINALAQIRQILTPEQYQKLLQLSGY
jgi:Spy/CpxP family protein refolding chaperone